MRTTDALISPLCKLSYNVVFINVVFLCFFFPLLLSKLSCLSVDLLSFSLFFFFFLLPADRKSVRGKTHRHDSNVWHTTLRSVQNVRELPFFFKSTFTSMRKGVLHNNNKKNEKFMLLKKEAFLYLFPCSSREFFFFYSMASKINDECVCVFFFFTVKCAHFFFPRWSGTKRSKSTSVAHIERLLAQ